MRDVARQLEYMRSEGVWEIEQAGETGATTLLPSRVKPTSLEVGDLARVKRLDKEVKLNKARRRAKIVVSDDEDAKKDTSKQGRSMIEDIDQDVGVSLVQIDVEDQGRFEDETDTQVSAHREAHSQGSQPEDQLGVFSAAKILVDVVRVHTYSRRRRTVSTGSGGISTAEESVSTVGASMPVSTAGMDQGSIPSPSATKDKGKAIMKEYEPEQATTKLKQRQEIAGYEAAIRLQEQLDEEESQRIARDAEVAQRLQEEIDASKRQRMAQVHQAAQCFIDAEWDDILARVVVDEDLVQQLQAGEKYSEEDLWFGLKKETVSTYPTDDKKEYIWLNGDVGLKPDIDGQYVEPSEKYACIIDMEFI
ncbi:hypothetical protein Tco_0880669 [Tanacetum coccineum]